MRDSARIERILNGDRIEADRFVTEHYPAVYRLLRYLTGSIETAEDLAQQTFLKAWRALPDFQRRASLRTWLHRIAYHEYTHWLRAKRDHAPLETAHNVPVPGERSELETFDLPTALNRLSEDHRSVFLLYHVQELSVREIAAILGVPGGTVKSRLFAARQNLRELLRDSETLPATQALSSVSVSLTLPEEVPHEMAATQRPLC